MSRQLRIDYPGAFFHVYSRGNRRQEIFLSDDDRFFFLKILGDAVLDFGIRFHAYCLMPNHYHLLIEDLYGALSKALHAINTRYTVYFNKKNDRCGHLFQGRFKSILVEAETYAWELVRYIHLNPVRAGLVSRPEQYHWSSHQEYVGGKQKQPWLCSSVILGRHDRTHTEDRVLFEKFVLAGIGLEPHPDFEASRRSGILGTPSFIDRISADHLQEQALSRDRERPQLRYYMKRPEMLEILESTEKELGALNRHTKEMTILICKRIGHYSLEEIGSFLKMSVSGVYGAKKRILKELEHNLALKRAFEMISIGLTKPAEPVDPTLLSESDKK
ncbi:MAG: transposase [Acidobacteria bacterium]|jgi:REP element-mobilizing transposase RayT|nr:transposase [Acidobacteriota bacterium]